MQMQDFSEELHTNNVEKNGVGAKNRKRKVASESEASELPPSKKQEAAQATEEPAQAESGLLSAAAYREQHSMKISGSAIDSFDPIQSFHLTKGLFPKKIRKACCNGFEKPTPIQAQCWPVLMAGRDIIGIAETGSGKTLTFLLPLVSRILSEQKQFPEHFNSKGNKSQPRLLVVAPTRELAMQTAVVASVMGNVANFNTLCVYGGVSKADQMKELRQSNILVLVATPGRLLDLVQCEQTPLSLSKVNYMVLDEADRMFDKGFEQDIRQIFNYCAPTAERQTALFSATWPESIRKLASEFLDNPVNITIGSEDLAANARVKQIVEIVDPNQKEKRLLQLLNQYHKPKKGELNRILIFVLYKKEADRVEGALKRNGWECESIHGDKSQELRTAALAKFKSGATQLLIATDVAARGLDIPDVKYVLNVTFPLTIEDYVHRIGRTGRGGKHGISHTLFTDFDKAHAGGLANLLREAGQVVPEDLTKFGAFTKKKEHGMFGAFFKEIDPNAKSKKVVFD